MGTSNYKNSYLFVQEIYHYEDGSTPEPLNNQAVCLGPITKCEANEIFNVIVEEALKCWAFESYDERFVHLNYRVVPQENLICSFKVENPDEPAAHEAIFRLYHPELPDYSLRRLTLMQFDFVYRSKNLERCKKLLLQNNYHVEVNDFGTLLAKALDAAGRLIDGREKSKGDTNQSHELPVSSPVPADETNQSPESLEDSIVVDPLKLSSDVPDNTNGSKTTDSPMPPPSQPEKGDDTILGRTSEIEQKRAEIEKEAAGCPLPERGQFNDVWVSRSVHVHNLATQELGSKNKSEKKDRSSAKKIMNRRHKHDRSVERGAKVADNGLSGWSNDGIYWKKHEVLKKSVVNAEKEEHEVKKEN